MKRVMVFTLVLAFALSAVAWAAKVSIKVTPTSVKAGKVVTVYGSTGTGCAKGDQVTLLSKAFSPRHEFAGVSAVFAKSGTGGAFSVKTTIPKTRKPGKYTIT